MKSIATIFFSVLLLNLTACMQPQTPSSAATKIRSLSIPAPENNNAESVVKTSMGDFVIVSAHFENEVHGEKPALGEKILLVILSQPGLERLDINTFSLEAFDKMFRDTSNGEIYILGDDGSRTISTMGGWVDEDFALGFRLPASVNTYTLFWQDNPPIELVVSEK